MTGALLDAVAEVERTGQPVILSVQGRQVGLIPVAWLDRIHKTQMTTHPNAGLSVSPLVQQRRRPTRGERKARQQARADARKQRSRRGRASRGRVQFAIDPPLEPRR